MQASASRDCAPATSRPASSSPFRQCRCGRDCGPPGGGGGGEVPSLKRVTVTWYVAAPEKRLTRTYHVPAAGASNSQKPYWLDPNALQSHSESVGGVPK